jgi:hypothetical protein
MTKTTALRRTGGGMAGWVNATWPLATLQVTSERLVLRFALLGTYEFSPEQVIEIRPLTWIPVLGWGVRIVHVLRDRPGLLIFWCLGRPSRLVERIRAVGFVPAAPSGATLEGRGIPVRWTAIVGAVALWNALFLLDGKPSAHGPFGPGRFACVAILLVFIVSTRASRSSLLQRVLLRPGRDVQEIAPGLRLTRLVAGILLVLTALTGVLTSKRCIAGLQPTTHAA